MAKEKGIFRTEHESSKINKLGDVIGWDTVGEGEYWSEEAMKPRELEEMYPALEGESEDDHKERLAKITETLKKLGGRALQSVHPSSPIELNKTHLYNGLNEQGKPIADPDGKVRGFSFTKHDSQEALKSEEYSDLFSEQMQKQASRDATTDERRARSQGELLYPEACKGDSEKIAEFYIGSLDFRQKAPRRGIFEGAGSGRYSEEVARKVQDKKRAFLERDTKTDQIPFQIKGKVFEGLFYPLVRLGFFDSPRHAQHIGSIILSSDYDDMFEHKVDVAAVVPIESTRKSDGKTIAKAQPISFGLTTGAGDKKLKSIVQFFHEKHGVTDIEYPSTCYKKELAPMKGVPHFALCIPAIKPADSYGPIEFRQFEESIAEGELPPQEIQDLINFQIYYQAQHWAKYWTLRQDIPKEEREAKARQFRSIAKHFFDRISQDAKGREGGVLSIWQRHPDATRFLSGLPRLDQD